MKAISYVLHNRLVGKIKNLLLLPLISINRAPLFVLGNQKSGTTAIAALLAELSNRKATLDIRAICEPVQTMLHAGRMTFEKFVGNNKLDFSRDLIKEPCLTFLYPELRRVFPDARFLMVVRDPRSNIRSILNRLKVPGDAGSIQLEQIPGITPEWKLVLDGKWLGLKGDSYIEMLAARWNLASDVCLQHHTEIFVIRYEDFIADKVGAIKTLADRFGLPQHNDISGKVDIQYQPRGNREISWEEFYGPENLALIERVCGSRMEEFGYRV